MPAVVVPACETCRFFKVRVAVPVPSPAVPTEPVVGECRRRAPGVAFRQPDTTPQYLPAWPLMPKGSWCGEYEAVPKVG